MDFAYTEQQLLIRQMVRRFVENEVAPGAEERDRTGKYPYDLYKRAGELGILGLRASEEYGGSNADFISACLAEQELGKVDLAFSIAPGMGGITKYLSELCTEEQLQKWKIDYFIPIVKGDAICSVAITEPDAGSDTAAIKTTAILDGEEWVINGTKAFISNAGLDNNVFTLVLALTDRDKKEFSFILVPKETPGYNVMPQYREMGIRSHDCHELAFQDCRVPAFNLVGGRGIGRRYTLDKLLAESRLLISSGALGLGQACLEAALSYAKQRLAFKRPISKFQHVQGMLVDIAVELELSELLRNKAAITVDNGEVNYMLACMVKYYVCEAANRAAYNAVQIHGGIGYIDETPVSRYFRDVRITTIYEGTSQIQKWIIARELGC